MSDQKPQPVYLTAPPTSKALKIAWLVLAGAVVMGFVLVGLFT